MNFKTNWFEIPANDFLRAVNFYKTIFEIDFQIFDSETEKMAFFPKTDNSIEGSISMAKGFEPSPNGVLVSFEVDYELDEFLKNVEKAGGKISIPKTKIECEGRGYFSCFFDSEGNRIGAHTKE